MTRTTAGSARAGTARTSIRGCRSKRKAFAGGPAAKGHIGDLRNRLPPNLGPHGGRGTRCRDEPCSSLRGDARLLPGTCRPSVRRYGKASPPWGYFLNTLASHGVPFLGLHNSAWPTFTTESPKAPPAAATRGIGGNQGHRRLRDKPWQRMACSSPVMLPLASPLIGFMSIDRHIGIGEASPSRSPTLRRSSWRGPRLPERFLAPFSFPLPPEG
jgi:hypothetical protein